MKQTYLLLYLTFIIYAPVLAQSTSEKEKVLQVVQQFFTALEQQDTLTFRALFYPDAINYIVRQEKDSVRIGSQSSLAFKFRKDLIIKERMRKEGVNVQIHKNIAMVWAPYDLWVNEQFSHCGVDVFTLIKGNAGWKIASISYTIEKEGCGNTQKAR